MGGSGAIDKKCCTKSRAVALGCKVDGSYADNQLIPQGSASKAFVSPKVRFYIITKRRFPATYTIKIYNGSNIYLDVTSTSYAHGDGKSRLLIGTHEITNVNAIGLSLSVSTTIMESTNLRVLQGFYEWELNSSNVPTNTIVLHEGDVFDIIFYREYIT